MSARLDALRRQFQDARSGIDTIENRARGANRDLTDAEQTEVDTLLQRCEDLTPDIEAEGARQDRQASAAAVLARIQPQNASQGHTAPNPGTVALPTAGEWMALSLRARQGDTEAAELLTRVVATTVTADTTGILPLPIIGPVLKLADIRRPVWSSFTSRPMPGSGKSFQRPRITQRVTVGQQINELDELASRKFTVAGDTVSKLTYGGVLELSEQDVDFTDPAIMQLVVQDFADTYVETIEARATTALVALATGTSAYTATNIGTIISSYMTGVQAVYNASKRLPDTLYLSLDQLVALASNTNTTTNVSALALLRQALDGAGFQLNIVVGPQLPAATRIIGCSSLVEAYEQQKGLLSAPDVSHLGVIVAYRAYAAIYGLASGFLALT